MRETFEALESEGLEPYSWSNSPGFVYSEHSHPYDKVLVCTAGSIVFHTQSGDIELAAGERMDLPAGTVHGATVGPDGVTCVEAAQV